MTVEPRGHQTFEERYGRPRPKPRARVTERYQMLIDGVITIDDLDDEEILRGQLRNKKGHFTGSPPTVIPYSLHQALQDSVAKRMERKLINSIEELFDSLIKIATTKGVNPIARNQAAIFLIERAIGKTPDKQEITQTVTAKWEDAAKGGRLFVDLDEEDDGAEIVDADVVE